jgi:hypothetical protein
VPSECHLVVSKLNPSSSTLASHQVVHSLPVLPGQMLDLCLLVQ